MKPTLVVLAAGMGSRYGGLKQMEQFGPSGETLMDYSIYDAIRAGFGKVVFIIRKSLEEDFRKIVLAKYQGKISVDLAYQELDMLPEGITPPADRAKPWGTGHAVWCARNQVREPFAAINADDFYGAEAYQVMAQYLSSITTNESTDFSMVGYRLKNTLSDYGTVARGVCEVKNGFLEGVVERTSIEKTSTGAAFLNSEGNKEALTGEEIVSMNFWGFTPAVFSLFGETFREFVGQNLSNPKAEFYIPLGVDLLIKQGLAKTKMLTSSASWFGVTYQDDKPQVISSINALVASGAYPNKLF